MGETSEPEKLMRAALRIITMILIEHREDWMTERRYTSPESLELAFAM